MNRTTETITGPQSADISLDLSKASREGDQFFFGDVGYIGGWNKGLERGGMPAMLEGQESQGKKAAMRGVAFEAMAALQHHTWMSFKELPVAPRERKGEI